MKIAAIYPGQGSQRPGMGKFLFDDFVSVKRKFEEASDAIGVDLKKLCFDAPESDLALTKNTQPALLLVSHCYHVVLNEIGKAQIVGSAGHSIGEYAAVVNEGVIPLGVGIKAVRKRGELMQSASPEGLGGMLAVLGIADAEVIEICKKMRSLAPHLVLEPANFNSPGQVVISGHLEAIEFLKESIQGFEFLAKKPKLIPLKVSAPFHCSLMRPAELGLSDHLEAVSFLDSLRPIVQNFSARAATKGPEIKMNLIRQVSAPVRWVECVQQLTQLSPDVFFELGVGSVLSGLNKKINSELKTINFDSLAGLKEVERMLT